MFTFQLIISFLAGGLFIALQTLIGERVSMRWRGIILTIPSTMAIGLFFIGLTKTPADAAQAALFIPASEGASYAFVTIFALLSGLKLFFNYGLSLFFWTIFAFLIIIFPPSTFLNSLLIFAFPVVTIGYLIVRKLPQESTLKKFPMNVNHIFFRSLLGGFVIATSVFLSKFLGNGWGGIFAAFPAVFSSTLIIYFHLQGRKVIPSVVKSMFFPGALSFPVYAIVAMWAFPIYGIWIGTLLAYLAYIAFVLIWDFGKGRIFTFLN